MSSDNELAASAESGAHHASILFTRKLQGDRAPSEAISIADLVCARLRLGSFQRARMLTIAMAAARHSHDTSGAIVKLELVGTLVRMTFAFAMPTGTPHLPGTIAGGTDVEVSRERIVMHIPKLHHIDPRILQSELEANEDAPLPQRLERVTGTLLSALEQEYHRAGSLATANTRLENEVAALRRTHAQAMRDLDEKRRHAEQAAAAKSRFLATVSHEMRTPLNALLGFSSVLDATDLSPEQRRSVTRLQDSGNHLLQLINDLIDISSIDAGRIQIEPHPTRVSSVIDTAVGMTLDHARTKRLNVQYELDETVPTVLNVDARRLRQIVVNLLSNAVKFTDQGTVRVTVEHEGHDNSELFSGALQITVSDSGCGIEADEQKRIFDAFTQGRLQNRRRRGGSGLGLAITAGLVRAMQGNIELSSEVGEGARFTVTIPIPHSNEEMIGDRYAKSHILIIDEDPVRANATSQLFESWGALPRVRLVGPDAPPLERHEFEANEGVALITGPEEMLAQIWEFAAGTRALMIRTSKGSSNAALAGARILDAPIGIHEMRGQLWESMHAPTTATDHHALRILLAEDNQLNQLVATSMLGRLGYQADHVGDGRAAYNACRKRTYDLVLMDLQMPIMDGLEATDLIRRDVFPPPKVVAMTAFATDADRQACAKAGMVGYIPKPITVQSLRDAIRQAVPELVQE